MAVDVGANPGKPAFGVQAGRQFGQRCGRGLVCAVGLAAVGGEAAVGFGQRRFPRGMAIDLAFGRGVAFARGVGLALGRAPGIARRSSPRRMRLSVRPRRFPGPDAWQTHRCGPAPARFRYRPAARARPDAAPRRLGRAPRRQIHPSARHRLPATPAAAQSSVARPARRRARGRRRRSAQDAAPFPGAHRHGPRAPRPPRAEQGRLRSLRNWSSASAPTDRPAHRDRRPARHPAPSHIPWQQ